MEKKKKIESEVSKSRRWRCKLGGAALQARRSGAAS
ncbi:hypothetical protein COLO4_28882 [Corchorus olitorius]|uniref:Uncharacterized protein n=1 Tax=Corchorus olitorius TaxID=93759 RepID=A0A1R3HI01_9ROSI|nr:hypothetical protein COLO4_28882 [Corchorus olitorius]